MIFQPNSCVLATKYYNGFLWSVFDILVPHFTHNRFLHSSAVNNLFSSTYWPMFVLIFYFLAPIPLMIAKRFGSGDSTSTACKELSIFFTTGIVISAFGLPCILAHSEAVSLY